MKDKDPIRFISTAETYAKAIISGASPVPEAIYDQYITALTHEIDRQFNMSILYPDSAQQYLDIIKRIHSMIEEVYQYGLVCANSTKVKEAMFLIKTLGEVRLMPPINFNTK